MLVDVVIYKTVHIGKYKIKEVIKMSYSRRTVTDGVTVMNKDLYDNLQDGIDEALKQEENAGFHNSKYRGKNLGTSLTSAQKTAISSGKFTDMYIGDYWVINGVTWRIAAFDYWYRCGDTDLTTHHVVIVPDSALYSAQMHNTSSGQYESGSANTTEGGYVGSDMYKTNLEQAKTIIKQAFGEANILTHKEYLTNAVSNGKASAGAWYDSQVDLMNERMTYGNPVHTPANDGTTIPTNYTVDKSQLPLFAFRPDLISNRITYWLRDVVSSAYFAYVDGIGGANCLDASYSCGVRPAFGIKG